jgi:hypothetical protein
LIRVDVIYMSAFLWERCHRRDGDLQTATHRPEGGVPTLIAALIAMHKNMPFYENLTGQDQ